MIKNSTRIVAAFLLVAAIVCGGCASVPSTEVDSFLAKQGFDAQLSHPRVTPWESQTFNLLKKEQWEAKSRTEVSNWKGAYYKFTIVKEGYQSHQEASARMKRLHEKPPGLGPEDDLVFPLREGFNVDNSVYIVSCRVSMFYEHMKDFTRAFEQAVNESRKRL